MLCGTLIGVVALLMVAPQAAAIPPSWDTQINEPSRFTVLSDFNKEAVLDKETGLVWQQSPGDARDRNPTETWLQAQWICNTRTVGNRKGWRLPTLQELASLVDPTQSNPALPSGHPFTNVQVPSSKYWSASTRALTPTAAWLVRFSDGDVSVGIKANKAFHVWCVRGGQGVDPQ